MTEAVQLVDFQSHGRLAGSPRKSVAHQPNSQSY